MWEANKVLKLKLRRKRSCLRQYFFSYCVIECDLKKLAPTCYYYMFSLTLEFLGWDIARSEASSWSGIARDTVGQ